MNGDDDAQGAGGDYTFVRLTNREVYAEVMATKDMVRDIKNDVRLLVDERNAMRSRVDKLEGRFNGILVGLGTGVVVGAVALLRGVIGG